MPTTSSFKVDGLQALGAGMQRLSSDVANRISGQATFAAAKLVKQAAVANIVRSPSVETGSLRDAVIVKKLPKSELGQLTSAHIVTVRGRGKPYTKKGKKINRAPYAHFIEFGKVDAPAEPFLRPALANNLKAAADAMADKLRARIAKVTPTSS